MTTAPIPTGDALRQACRDLGLDDGVADALLTKLLSSAAVPPPAVPPPVEPRPVEPPTRRETEMMRLLNTKTPDKLVHDLRNVLNELILLKAAAEL